MRWVERYENDGEIKRYDKEPIAYKVHKKHVKFILEEITKNKMITMDELYLKIKNKFDNFELSKMHIHRIINDNNITLKLSRVRHEPIKRFGKDIDINKKLKEFYTEIKKYNINDVICIDETSINAFQKRNHCYSDLGKRCVIKTTSQEVFKKYTAIFAISTKGVLGWKLYEKGGIDTDRLTRFLEKYITEKYKKKIIILDNASSHRNEIVKDLINKKNKVLYSIPYQHFTNSIEAYFNVIKTKLQKYDGLTYDEIKHNIKKVIKKIQIEIYENIFKGAYERPEKYVSNKKSRKKPLKNYL